MFRLEKVFQNDDKFFIIFSNILKSLILYLIIYLFSILENNSIFEIKNYKIYSDSSYFLFSKLFLLTFFLLINILNKSYTNFYIYYSNIYRKDFISLGISIVFVLLIYLILDKNLNINFLYLIISLFISLLIFISLDKRFYNYLVNKNYIQKNILLIGNYESIKRIINEKKNEIYVYKCCIITDKNIHELKKIRFEFKIPIFNINEDIRSLLEYHSLGQIWILNDNIQNIEKTLEIVIKYSVDILIINLFQTKKNENLINGKYSFENFDISKFYGFNFLLKIILDKILSIIFLIILSPLLIISMIAIYLEDGSPVLFLQDRTGWDGRRFKIYKLRSLKNTKFIKTDQVIEGDKRLLKIGKIIRKFSIDEVPQFFNVITGDMSIVGPRPHMVEHDIYYSNLFKDFLKRHKANPGLTGWAQIHGLRGATKDPDLMKKRMEYDLWYLNNWSLLLDINIIFKTFSALIKYKG